MTETLHLASGFVESSNRTVDRPKSLNDDGPPRVSSSVLVIEPRVVDVAGSRSMCPRDGSPVLRLLVVDDDSSLRKACCEIGTGMGIVSVEAGTAREARSALKNGPPVDILLLDVKLPDGSGLELLNEVKALYPRTAVVVMTAYATVPSAVEAMRTGALNYLTKPFDLQKLTDVLDESIRNLRFDIEGRRLWERLRTNSGMGDLVGTSDAMQKVYSILTRMASSNHPILILGEEGTGKETVARSIHSAGRHACSPFISVDCDSLSPSLIEAQLFGHENGASPEAQTSKEGLLSAADGGTVLLNDIDKLPLDTQAKLFRALRDKETYQVGANRAVPISTRLLAASTLDLNAMAARGLFRKDLYLRLNIVNLKIPSLRERKDDIPLLVEHYLDLAQRNSGKSYSFSKDAVQLMIEYDWPENLSELQHAVESACAIASSRVLTIVDLPAPLRDFRVRQLNETIWAQESVHVVDTVLSIAEMEKQAILSTIRQCNGKRLLAAKLLGIGKTTLYRKLKEYEIVEDDSQTDN